MLSRLKEEWLALALMTAILTLFCYPILLGLAFAISASTFDEANKTALCLLVPSLLWLLKWSCLGRVFYQTQMIYSLTSWLILAMVSIQQLQIAHNAGWNEWYASIITTALLLIVDGLYAFSRPKQ
ncbi:hypothetical protein [Vibrio parahaemolyticus]|uniref:hypothetical protein n=1 Tax=Vibrio parahaemolyticus TaxID=670 RepID=UPI0038920206